MFLSKGAYLLLLLPLVRCVTFGDSHIQTELLDTENNYLKVVFPGDEEEHVRFWECPEGIWAEDMHLKRKPNCVCVRGVYAIGSDLCEESFMIIAGDGHCFDIRGRTIRKFIPLIGSQGLYGKANTVFRMDAPYFARLNSPTPTTSLSEVVHYVFRMNDPEEFTAYSKLDSGIAARLKCYGGIYQDDEGPKMHIARLPNCSNEFRGPKQWCKQSDMRGEYEWELRLGESWTKDGGKLTGEKYPGNCKGGGANDGGSRSGANGPDEKKTIKKTGIKRIRGRRKRWAPKKIKAKSEKRNQQSGAGGGTGHNASAEVCNQFDIEDLEPAELDTSTDHFFQSNVQNRNPKFHSASFHQKEVNMQNRRIGHFIRKFYLDGKKRLDDIPKFSNFPEYKYIQISKEILKTICPHEYVHPYVVDFLIRAFRLLFIDSSPGYPYPIKHNQHEHKRIHQALMICKDKARPIQFIRNKTCPDAGIIATNQSLNESVSAVHHLQGNGTNVNLTMPGNARFNISSMDASVELVWKLTMLTHYYCTDHFAAHPFDFSAYFVRMEAFLKNPAIMFRWYYPGQFNEMLQFFLMNENLDKFARGVDKCVETVFARSVYTDWMRRPAEALVWSAKSKMLPHDVSKSFNSPTGNFGRGRKKRFYLQDDMWQKQAYCMHTTDAPYTEVRTGTFLSCKKKPVWFDNTDSCC